MTDANDVCEKYHKGIISGYRQAGKQLGISASTFGRIYKDWLKNNGFEHRVFSGGATPKKNIVPEVEGHDLTNEIPPRVTEQPEQPPTTEQPEQEQTQTVKKKNILEVNIL